MHAFAAAHGLSVVDGHLELPDLRIEYETADGRHESRDVELVTEHYSRAQLAGKAQAGFSIYRAAGAGRLGAGASGRAARRSIRITWSGWDDLRRTRHRARAARIHAAANPLSGHGRAAQRLLPASAVPRVCRRALRQERARLPGRARRAETRAALRVSAQPRARLPPARDARSTERSSSATTAIAARSSPAAIARKLMLLDYVLTVPDAEWHATEEDKVTFFTRELGVPIGDLPQSSVRTEGPAPQRDDAAVHPQAAGLPHKRSAVVHFVYLVNDDDRPRTGAVSPRPRPAVRRASGVGCRRGLPARAERIAGVPSGLQPLRLDDVAARAGRGLYLTCGGSSPRGSASRAAICGRCPSPTWTASAKRGRASRALGWKPFTAHGSPTATARSTQDGPRAAGHAGARRSIGRAGTAVDLQPVRIAGGGVLMGPAAWRSDGPVGGPSAGPAVRSTDRRRAPEALPQSPCRTMTLRRATVLGDAALFAACGVEERVTGEGGATPSNSRRLDPAPRGAGRPAGVAPPSPVTQNRIARWHATRSGRDRIAIATVSCH